MDKNEKKKLRVERKERKKKIKHAFKGHKGTMTWDEIEEILKD